jgi:hypothetical protein
VYWRRRALVLAVLVLVGFVIAYALAGNKGTGPTGPIGSASMATATMTALPTGTPTAGTTSTPATTSTPTVLPTPGVTTAQPVTGPCTDAEILLTATASPATLQVGQTATFTLAVKNVSQRTCNRNTGSIPQELQLRRGETVVWSSDECTNATLYNYDQVFTPGFEKRFDIDWHGYRTRTQSGQTNCLPVDSNRPGPGDYTLVARLGGLYSQPVPVTIHSGA